MRNGKRIDVSELDNKGNGHTLLTVYYNYDDVNKTFVCFNYTQYLFVITLANCSDFTV